MSLHFNIKQETLLSALHTFEIKLKQLTILFTYMSVQNFLPVLSLSFLSPQLYMCEPKAGQLDDTRDTEYIGVMQKNRGRSSAYLIEEERN